MHLALWFSLRIYSQGWEHVRQMQQGRRSASSSRPQNSYVGPFSNLAEPKKGRRGEGLTASDMEKWRWLEPQPVATIEYLEWTAANYLTHTSFSRMGGKVTADFPESGERNRCCDGRRARCTEVGWGTWLVCFCATSIPAGDMNNSEYCYPHSSEKPVLTWIRAESYDNVLG
jgi:hypothetical protein